MKVKKIGWQSAASIVVANMVGIGAFTSLGFQLTDLRHSGIIISLWVIGGITALFGALSYAELGTRYPQSGGEYFFLSKIYHPFVGYLSGWVSLTVGFSASIALAAMALAAYTSSILHIHPKRIAVATIVFITLVHSFDLDKSRGFQNVFTVLKLTLIMGMVLFGFLQPIQQNAMDWEGGFFNELTSPSYAIALVYTIYAYSGWNAASYIVGEIKAPRKNLPKALLTGTVIVSVLYILLQVVFLRMAPLDALVGKVEVAQIVAKYMFGSTGGKLVSLAIGFLLISSISAMVWVGPRVMRAMANDHRIWYFLAKDNAFGIPVRAIWLQGLISIFLILTSTFEQVLIYSGFILQLFNMLAVGGLFFVRKRNDVQNSSIFLSPGFPFIQLIYLVLQAWILIFIVYDKPFESMLGLTNLVLGSLSYWGSRYFSKKLDPKGIEVETK